MLSFRQKDVVNQLKQRFRENKFQANQPDPITGKTELHIKAEAGLDEVVRYLRRGLEVTIDHQDVNGNTPLNSVIQSKTLFPAQKDKVIRELLAGGANAMLPNNDGDTPLMNLYHLRQECGDNGLRGLISKWINEVQKVIDKKSRTESISDRLH